MKASPLCLPSCQMGCLHLNLCSELLFHPTIEVPDSCPSHRLISGHESLLHLLLSLHRKLSRRAHSDQATPHFHFLHTIAHRETGQWKPSTFPLLSSVRLP